MKAITVKQLDNKDEEIAGALISLGMGRPVARALTYLLMVDEAMSSDLEKGTGLRQPEVSIAVKQLKESGWIKQREEKKPGKGRPYNIFSLKIGFNKIVAQLDEQNRKVADEMQSKIGRLKDITRS